MNYTKRAQVRAMLEDGKTVKEIALALGYKYASFFTTLKRNGINIHHVREDAGIVTTDWEAEKQNIINMIRSGAHTNDIAAHYNVTPARMRNIHFNLGISVRRERYEAKRASNAL